MAVTVAAQQGGGKKAVPPADKAAKGEKPKKPLPLALAKNVWKPGQSGNPSGKGGLYMECLMLARRASPDAMRKMIVLMDSEDERVALMAQDKVLERAWGKVKELDPNEGKSLRPDLSVLSVGQIKALRGIMKALAENAAVMEPGDDEGPVIEGTATEV